MRFSKPLHLLTLLILISTFFACLQNPTLVAGQSSLEPGAHISGNPYYSRTDTTVLHVSDAEWKKVLSDEVFQVARLKGTERAFTGKYWNYTGIGTYYCAACGNALFRSDGKFASECGWPSFFQTMRTTAVTYLDDHSYNMERVEVNCGRCGGHLGHLFDDGPPPTYKRYCMNSIMLDFEPDTK
jgi:peptide-methionine (R)-S-oxide reductase